MNHFTAPDWLEIFEFNGLRRFEDFWKLAHEWFEAPNQRRGGWSGVAKTSLSHPDGAPCGVFIKKQQNHNCRTWRHPVSGEPTFQREFDNLRRFQQHGIPAPDVLYFGRARADGNDRAILITRALTDFVPLSELVREWDRSGWPALRQKRRIVRAVAEGARRMHEHQRAHNCFYPKHIFVRHTGEDVDIRFIDLEKAKWRPRSVAMLRDLGTLLNRSGPWSRTDRLCFLKAYLGAAKISTAEKRIWRTLARRATLAG